MQKEAIEDITCGNKLIVLVRHSGCTFCRETLAALAKVQDRIFDAGFAIYVIHMGDEQSAEKMAESYNLSRVKWVSDPEKSYYRHFGFARGGLVQLFGPRVWLRGFVAGVLNGHGVGALEGDGFQLGGVVLVREGESEILHRSKDAADIGDFDAMAARIEGYVSK